MASSRRLHPSAMPLGTEDLGEGALTFSAPQVHSSTSRIAFYLSYICIAVTKTLSETRAMMKGLFWLLLQGSQFIVA